MAWDFLLAAWGLSFPRAWPLHLWAIPDSPCFHGTLRLPRLSLSSPPPPARLRGGGDGCRAAKNSSSSSSLLEGSVEPKIGEEESGTGSGERRDQPELRPEVPAPRTAGCRDMSTQTCRDVWTQTPRIRWTTQGKMCTDMATCRSGASSPRPPGNTRWTQPRSP